MFASNMFVFVNNMSVLVSNMSVFISHLSVIVSNICVSGKKPPGTQDKSADVVVHETSQYTAAAQAWPGTGATAAATSQILPVSLDSAWRTQQAEEEEPGLVVTFVLRATGSSCQMYFMSNQVLLSYLF